MRDDALSILNVAIDAVKPPTLIPRFMSLNNNLLTIGNEIYYVDELNHIYVIAVGKAAAAMAVEAEKILDKHISGGIVISKYDHVLPLQYLEYMEAGHPLPDHNGIIAAEKIKVIATKAEQDDLVIVLLSGGASALVADLADGIDLEDMVTFSRLLLHSGADIHEINVLRKHLSFLKGGQLAALVWPASLVCLAVSDVSADDPSSIGSGLTVPDESSFEIAWSVIEKYLLADKAPKAIIDHLLKGRNGLIKDTPVAADDSFSKSRFYLVGNNETALNAAARKAISLGYHTIITDVQFTGNVEIEASNFYTLAINYNGQRPACILAGGESTVTIKGSGTGGRNQQMALAFLNEWKTKNAVLPHLLFLSSATDGSDGPTTAAGAMVDQQFIDELATRGKDPTVYLHNNDAWHFFENTSMHIITGPTQTNVMDIVIILLGE